MKVFVTGATGYIGFAVATALRRAGHEVWGLARDAEKARRLAQAEILPVIGRLQDIGSYVPTAERCSVLVHAAADPKVDVFALDERVVHALLAAAHQGPQPKTIVYTSGVWVHGDTGHEITDETTPLRPAKQVGRRPAIEQQVLHANSARGLVLRPGCVYGHNGGLTGMWFHGAVNRKELSCVGDGYNRWAMVHVDDLADAYVRAVESGLAGEVFDITDRSRSTVRQMLDAVARVTGFAGEIRSIPLAEAARTMGDFAECLALDQHVDARKAVRLLGWQPKQGGFVDGVATYFESWLAAQPA